MLCAVQLVYTTAAAVAAAATTAAATAAGVAAYARSFYSMATYYRCVCFSEP